VPELNRRLTDKILIALNLARANKQMEVAMHLQQALTIAERRRQERLAQRPLTQPEETSSEP
jgi:hypothetical protein